jgi:hypothetical protein
MKLTSILPLLAVLLATVTAEAQSPIRPGDHIAIVGNTFADQLRIHGYLETLLIRHSDVSIRNLGWGGDMLTARDRPTGFPSEESTLSDHKTDVIIACFGMGESFAGPGGIENFKSDLKAFVESHRGKKYNGESEVRLILVSPIACEDHGKLTPALEKRNRDLKFYTLAMSEVASESKLPFVDLFEPSRYLMNESKQAKLTTNGIHLNAFGYWAISHVFFEQLTATTSQPWRLSLDVKALESNATGVEISALQREGPALSFTVTEESAPSLPPQCNAELPTQLASQRDRLSVSGLETGDYTLAIDGEQIVTASADDWARGLPIDASPAHAEAEAYRALVNDKNLQFTYSWKALNQVHIVGERRTSPSGRALPAEVVEFEKLADQRDEDLRKKTPPKVRVWRLAPSTK